jgi:ferredoxin
VMFHRSIGLYLHRNINLFINKKTVIMAYLISDDCTACGTCIDECPVEAISEGDIYKIDPDMCTDCGTCADACPIEAIHPA